MGTGNSVIMNEQRIGPPIMLKLSLSIFAPASEARLAPRAVLGHRKDFATFVRFTARAIFQEIVEFPVEISDSKHLSRQF